MINSLTSLRLIFAMMVFGAHCYIIDSFFDAHFFKEGFVGVSFFFVLSGFIIAYNYQEKLQERQITKRTFWVARIARIYPLHWLTLFLAASLGGYVVCSGTADWWKHFLASLTLTNAYVPTSDYFFSFNSPSWSLCCEQLFYFCFPFLIPLAKDWKRLLCLFAVLAVLTVVGMSFTPEEYIKGYWYVNPIARFPDFIVGMLLFRVYIKIKDVKMGMIRGTLMEWLAIFMFFIFYLNAADAPKVYRYTCYYWVPVAVLILVFALQKGWFSRLLSHRWLVTGGEISYSFYLIHLFVLQWFVNWQKETSMQIPWYVAVPVLFCIVIALSLLSYRCFEKPSNRIIKKLLNK